MSNPFWEFSLCQYARPGVAEACLAAQDDLAADVNLLLYAAWLTRQDLELSAGQWCSLEAELQAWRQQVLLPLRALRRSWRQLPAADRLRQQLQALELEAERDQQQQIWLWHQRGLARSAGEGALGRQLGLLLDAGEAPAERDRLLQQLTVLLAS